MQVNLSTSGGSANLEDTVTVTASIQPQQQAVLPVSCKFLVDGVQKALDTSYPLTFVWDTTAVADGNHVLKAVVTAGPRTRSAQGAMTVSVFNNPVPPPPPPPIIQDPPVNTTPPTISGTATEGQTLGVEVGSWTNSPTSYTFQWTRCDAAGANCLAIPNATGSTYILTAADVGVTVRCSVTALNSVGPSVAVQTAQTAVVGALTPAVPVLKTAPVIAGTYTQGHTISVSNGSWENSPTAYLYQWRRCDSSGAACANISGATGATYVQTSADVGKTIRCVVTAQNASGSSSPSTTTATPVVSAPPPPSGKLRWAPPTLGAGGVAVVDYTLTNANKGGMINGGGRDLRITQTEVITGGGATYIPINGWRNVVWIGGEINVSAYPTTAIVPRDCTGTLHFEGIWIHGNGSADALTPRLGKNQIIRVQNCRFEVNTQAAFHADCIQTQGAEIAGLHTDKCSFVSNYQGIFLRNSLVDNAASYIHDVILQRTNFRGGPNNAFWQTWEEKDLTTTHAIVPITLVSDVSGRTVWLESATPGSDVFPATSFEDGFVAGAATMRRGCFVLSDANGQYVKWSDGTGVVPAGGPKSGQATLSCQIAGQMAVGVPPGGDYCPVGVPKIGYISPGYQ